MPENTWHDAPPAEWADQCEEALSSYGSRLEDRGHEDSVELTIALVGRALVAAVRELADETRKLRPAVGEVSDAIDNAAHEVERVGKAVTDAS